MPAESSHPHGEVFLDTRGHGRALRLTWHHEADVVVLSLWRERLCAGTFRLAKTDVTEFIDALVDGLRESPARQIVAGPPAQTGEVGVTSAATAAPPAPRETFTDWAFGDDPSRASA